MLWIRRALSWLILAALLGGGGYLVRARLMASSRPAAPVYATAKATRGTMTADVVGFGPLQPVFLSTLQATAGGTVQKVMVQAGDSVGKGEVIAVLANPTLTAKIAQDKAKLQEDARILATTLGVPASKALSAAAAAGAVTVTAPQTGRVVTLKVSQGDTVTQGQPLVQIVDDAQVEVDVNLVAYDRARVATGDPVRVHFQDFTGEVDGVITQMSPNATPVGVPSASAQSGSAAGGSGTGAAGSAAPYLVFPAVLTLSNPGLLAPGMTGTVAVKTAAGWDTLSEPAVVSGYGREDTVGSPIAGTVVALAVQSNAWVTKGQPLLTVGGAAATTAIAGLAANVQQDQATLQEDEQQLAGLTIRSDLVGKLSWLNARPGMRVNQNQPIGSIFDSSRMTLNIRVNELQVANVKAGQSVVVTSPGLPGRTFQGKVASVASIGQSNGGLATFTVQIDINGTSALKPGMTADARIVIATVPNALMVPVEAVLQQGSQAEVEVLTGKKPTFVPVSVGLVNDRFAQIKAGLHAGEVVVTGAAGGFPATGANSAGAAGTSGGTQGRSTGPVKVIRGKAVTAPAPQGGKVVTPGSRGK